MPKRFDELLSNDKINREVLCWLKAWDPIVFNKNIKSKK
jgi:chromosome transmission fidelity protein 18